MDTNSRRGLRSAANFPRKERAPSKHSTSINNRKVFSDVQNTLRAEMTARRDAAWRGKLASLTRYRYGNHHLPDNSEGRTMLLAFLWCDLKADDAMERAPWLTADELESLELEARCVTKSELGKLIGLKNKERYDCKVFFLAASDVTPEEAARYQAERDRENARKRQMKLRQSREKMRHTTKRDDAVLRMLAAKPNSWTPVSDLVKEAGHCNAFRRPDGWGLRDVRSAVNRAIKTLEAHGQIEMKQRPGMRGMVCVVRLADWNSDAERDAHCHADAERDAFCDAQKSPENFSENAERDGFCHRGTVFDKNRAKTSAAQEVMPKTSMSRCEYGALKVAGNEPPTVGRMDWHAPALVTMPYTPTLRRLHADEMDRVAA
jgi:hypothetical protein